MKWFCLLLAAVIAVPAAAAEKTAKIRVLLTYGGHGFEEKLFFAMWDAMPGVEYTKARCPNPTPCSIRNCGRHRRTGDVRYGTEVVA